jgi:hypothetical protein
VIFSNRKKLVPVNVPPPASNVPVNPLLPLPAKTWHCTNLSASNAPLSGSNQPGMPPTTRLVPVWTIGTSNVVGPKKELWTVTRHVPLTSMPGGGHVG